MKTIWVGSLAVILTAGGPLCAQCCAQNDGDLVVPPIRLAPVAIQPVTLFRQHQLPVRVAPAESIPGPTVFRVAPLPPVWAAPQGQLPITVMQVPKLPITLLRQPRLPIAVYPAEPLPPRWAADTSRQPITVFGRQPLPPTSAPPVAIQPIHVFARAQPPAPVVTTACQAGQPCAAPGQPIP